MPRINIILNGEPREISDALSIEALSEELGINKDRAAFELNREILDKTVISKTILQDGDVLEIVTFVGGG
jgi:thiamine biosynthesis protein ThiS